MGQINNIIYHYMTDRHRFADLFNGVYFSGKKIICAEELTEASAHYAGSGSSTRKDGRLERFRDVRMSMKTGETFRLLALENQNMVDYTMPFRCMQYDTMDYHRQIYELKKSNKQACACLTAPELLCGFRQADRLTPIYTLCLYHGEDEWNGPRSLKDMMRFGKEDEMEAFFADYPLRLFCVNEESDFTAFNTELKEVFQSLIYRRDKIGLRRLVENEKAYRHLSRDTVEAISVLLNVPRLWEDREKYISKGEEEEYDMCQALREMLDDERKEGIEQGIEQGAGALIQTCEELGCSREETMDRVRAKFSLEDKMMELYMVKYWQKMS